MNLRMDDKGVRFRITPEELSSLLAGRDIDCRLCIGRHSFGYRISPDDTSDEMTVEMAVGGFCLHVPRTVLDSLNGMGRSKEGVFAIQDGVTVSLQVDLKLQARKAA